MTLQPEHRASRGNLAIGVGLDDTAAHHTVRPGIARRRQVVFELADLIASDAKPRAVVTFDQQARTAERGGQSWHRLQRRRQMRQQHARYRFQTGADKVEPGCCHDMPFPTRPPMAVHPTPGQDFNRPCPLLPDLTNRVALVTGASRGIGRAVAIALAEIGADIAVNYRERAADAQAVADVVRSTGRRSVTIGADVSDGAEVAKMLHTIEAELGPVDVLVNNAGMAIIRGVDDLTEAEFDLTLAVNLKSVFLSRRQCCQACAPDTGGASSISHLVPRAGQEASACITTPRRLAWRV